MRRSSTRYGPATVLRRAFYRLGVHLWGRRVAVGIGLAATLLLLGAFAFTRPVPAPSVEVAGIRNVNGAGDCADTAMAFIANANPNTARAAYRCMAETITSQASEDQFMQQVTANPSTVTVGAVTRIGEYPSASGGKIVYYALDARGQSIGYLVYLGSDGKVLRME